AGGIPRKRLTYDQHVSHHGHSRKHVPLVDVLPQYGAGARLERDHLARFAGRSLLARAVEDAIGEAWRDHGALARRRAAVDRKLVFPDRTCREIRAAEDIQPSV